MDLSFNSIPPLRVFRKDTRVPAPLEKNESLPLSRDTEKVSSLTAHGQM